MSFKLDRKEGLPSGLLRVMDRLGLAAWAKGHATITMTPPAPKKEGEDEDPRAATTLTYQATFPYADLKIKIGNNNKLVLLSSFGLRGVVVGCPPFLDETLKAARETLTKATTGAAPLEAAQKARAVQDALNLIFAGKRDERSLRQLYPLGLSQNVAAEIMRNAARALAQQTRRSRAIAAVILAAVSAALDAGLYLTPLYSSILKLLPYKLYFAFDMLCLALTLALGWFGVGQAARLVLQRHHPQASLNLHRQIGKIGYSMLAAIVVFYFAILFCAPIKPFWLH